MNIYFLNYDIKLQNVFSIKDKRSLRLRFFNDLKKKFNISILESNYRNNLDILSFSICFLSPDSSLGDNYFESIDKFISLRFFDGCIINVHKEII
ncbi:MAG: DUF503 family protein [Lagierella massiliensis]|nr:DUF503 family protein [Lagierella massiliensis]